MDNTQMEINGRITRLMEGLGLNQKQFADLLGVTQPAVSKYLRNRIPPALVLLKLANLAGTSVEWILTGKYPGRPSTVAESAADYVVLNSLTRKIENLTPAVQKGLLSLVESLSEE